MGIFDKRSSKMFSTIIVSFLAIQSIHAYSSGAPNSRCFNMEPGHGYEPLITADPVKLIITNPRKRSNIGPGQIISVSLKATKGRPFKGFMIQARNQDDKPVGSWTFRGNDIRTMDCPGDDGNSISHNNSNEKMEIKATWQAPNSFSGSIVFKYTVVMNYSEEPYYGVA